MTEDEVLLAGVGLHSGAPVRIRLRRSPGGPVRLHVGNADAAIHDLCVASTARATTVEAPGTSLRVGTVEHALAALAGLGIRAALRISVEGPEMPLLDGGAETWCDALVRLRLASSAPSLRVARAATYTIGPSRYDFVPGDSVDIGTRVEFATPGLEPEARWRGDAEDFRRRIAPARTFALTHELEELERRGLARSVDPRAVMILAPDTVHCFGRPFTPDEPARHKLLDFLGDLYLHGGPALGRVDAFRPGHAPNHRALRRAIEDGTLVPFAAAS